ncbi:MAG: cyclophilin-like family protein [Nitrosopumilaceae archaeon]
MKNKIALEIPKLQNIILELDDKTSPKTVNSLLDSLPFSVGINLWGQEIYTDETPVKVAEENAKPVVELNDVAYWPTGKAVCLFYGPTPIGKKGEIKPYSPVNVIGKIVNPDKSILSKIKNGTIVSFKKNN